MGYEFPEKREFPQIYMNEKENIVTRHFIEFSTAGVIILGLFLIFKVTSGGFISGFVVADFNQTTKVIVDQEIDEQFLTQSEVDIIIEYSNVPRAEAAIKALNNDEFRGKHRFRTFNGESGRVNQKGLEKLRKDPNIKKIHLDRKLEISLGDSVELIRANDTWQFDVDNIKLTGSGSVCILDTGIDRDHPDLVNNYIIGYDFVNSNDSPEDDNGHGTHVSGIVAANGTVVGVAPSSKIIAIKVCNSLGSCSASDVAAGIEWCVSNKSAYNIKVISMSLGGGIYSENCDAFYPTITSAADDAVSNGLVVFAASGNQGSTIGIASPACIANIISVGNSDKSDNVFSGGNRHAILDVVAPGISITSTWLNGGYASLGGTSMSAPHAAGAANLLMQYSELKGESINNDDIRDLLTSNGKLLHDDGTNLDFPRINVYASLLALDDDKPSINVNSIVNNTVTSSNFVFINASSDERLKNAYLEWNDENLSMDGSYKTFNKNVTNISAVNFYKVYGIDLADNIGSTDTLIISLNSSNPY